MLEQILDVEHEAFLFLNGGHTPFLDQFIWLFTGKIVWIPVAVFILFILCYKKDWKESLLILLSIVLVITLCDQFASSICKPFFTRFRPTQHPEFMDQVQTVHDYRGGRYGFISSHAANAFGFATYTLLLFKHRIYTCIILAWGTFMSYTRIYLGVHFISDIIPAIFVGLIFSFLCYKLYLLARKKILKTDAVPEELYTLSQKRSIIFGILATVGFISIISLIKVY